MSHPEASKLVEHYYDSNSRVAAHLLECAACRNDFQTLASTLNELRDGEVESPDSAFDRRLWQALRPRLQVHVRAKAKRRLLGTAALVAAAASLSVVMLFHPQRAITKKAPVGNAETALSAALSDHLERSQILLTEIEHRTAGDEQSADERLRAQTLLEDNRRLREATLRRGEVRRATMLDDLEPTLVTIASAPAQMSKARLASLQEQLKEDGSLFKVRVARSHLMPDATGGENGNARRGDRIRGPL